MWVAHNKVGERLEDIQIPFSDVKNVLDEVHFQDEATRSRCRGWLVLKSRKYLQADILFPGCKYDCTRLAIRGRTGVLWFSYSFLFYISGEFSPQKSGFDCSTVVGIVGSTWQAAHLERVF